MNGSLARLMMTAILTAVTSLAYAQGQTGSLTGTVVDKDGGVIPGAAVVVKNNATSVATNTVTNAAGAFSVPALAAGTYTVTISLQGFKQVVITSVVVQADTQASVRVVLQIGQLSETVEVKGGTELVQTQSASVSTTLDVDQIAKLPAVSRNVLNFITFLPGVDTTTTNRGSTMMGLPQSALSITLDGVNVQDNFQKNSDGFFAAISPRQDAIEQVTVSLATPGAANSGQGAVQIAFVTRSGTNQYKGTAYHYYRDTWMNTNYWFNKRNGLPRNDITLNQFGASEGGPIVIPRLYDGRGKAFFFFNHEEFIQPTETSQSRTIANPLTQTGVFQYNVTTGGVTTVQTVNLLQLAAAQALATGNPAFTSTPDPTVVSLLAAIRQSTTLGGVITQNTDPNTMTYRFNSPARQHDQQPTLSLDYNVTPRHRVKVAYHWERSVRDPDFLNGAGPRFIGFPQYRIHVADRPSYSINLRSTLSSTMVNEVKGGWAGYKPRFGIGGGSKYPDENAAQFENQGGFSLGLGLFSGATTETSPSARYAPTWNIDETLTWLRGNHNMSFGGNFTHIYAEEANQTVVPSVGFGVLSGQDPADAMFNTTNFPGASNATLTNARTLYAVLTGRVTSINADARIDENTLQYVYLGRATDRNSMKEYGLFAQDQWRITPTLTANMGVRWEVALPFQPENSIYTTLTFESFCGVSGVGSGNGPGKEVKERKCNLFRPGTLPANAVHPQFHRYDAKDPGYKTFYGNFAPNVGVAWRPNVQSGVLRKVLGDPEQATVRAGYSVAYNRNSVDQFVLEYGNNPGVRITTNRNSNNGNIILPGESVPLLYRDRGRLGAPSFNTVPTFPRLAANEIINIFDPEIKPAYSKSYTIGLQRSIGRDMAVEFRYVGTRNIHGWTEETWNDQNIYESGFLDEFKLAQANLRSNIANSRGNTFAYFGPGTGTSPLPIYLAAFTATPISQAGVVANYQTATAVTNFTNTTFVGRLDVRQPFPYSALNDLYGNATRRGNLLNPAVGFPINQFVMNPDLGGSQAFIMRSRSFSKYDSLQIDLRRRLSRGLQVGTNYTYSVRYGSTFDDLHFDRYLLRSEGVPWAWKGNWTYELPFGKGRRYGTNAGTWLDSVIGGWEWDGTMRFQHRNRTMSEVVLVGMTRDELQREYKIRIDQATRNVYMLPDDIILNTQRAFSTSATSADGYSTLGPPTGRYIAPAGGPDCFFLYRGDCGSPREGITLNAPPFTRFDFSFKKAFKISRKANVQFQVDVLNAFNATNFNPVLNPGSGATIFQVTSAYQDVSNTFDPGGRLGQIVWRVNW